jgi:exopolysaccharide production protein ExoY
MSLVGPRPLTATELDCHYGCRIPQLLAVKPGLTGLWQTQGRGALDWPTRVSLDFDHLRSHSAKKYFTILYRTFPILISGRGAW